MASEDPQDQLDEAIKKAERLAEELNREKDPQAQLDEAINEAKRLAEELNPERENKKKKTNKPLGIRFRWRQRDERGQIVPQTRKATTSTSVEETNENMDRPQVLQRTIEVLFLSIKQRKQNLYCQTDGCKKRHPLRRKILEEKDKLTAAIEEYNTLVPDSAIPSADEILSTDLHAWPWELH
ncbi:ribonuclease Y-like [Salvelinus alpinus]|uniref:ribonuclease Y-like n=1 Tax=Salvelinus alpinus TaxID=8036 RepID=UPI0039FD2E06